MARAHAHDGADDTTPVRRRFTIDEYHRMGEAGIFHEDDRVELLDGAIVEMSPIGTRHTGGVNRLNALFNRRLGRRAVVSVQNPIVLDDFSEPQPDVMILAPHRLAVPDDRTVSSDPKEAQTMRTVAGMISTT